MPRHDGAGPAIQPDIDHHCLVFGEAAEFRDAAVAFLEEGRRRGERLMYVAAGDEDSLRGDLAALEDRDRLLASGALELHTATAVYDREGRVDPELQRRTYDAAVTRALADGYSGLCVAADATALAASPAARPGMIRWEAVADRFMAERPMRALCGYDAGVVEADTLACLGCVHAHARGPEGLAPFHLAAADGALRLTGAVDTFAAPALARLLELLPARAGTVVDLDGLDFIDHNGVLALHREARRRAANGGWLELRSPPPAVGLIARLLELDL